MIDFPLNTVKQYYEIRKNVSFMQKPPTVITIYTLVIGTIKTIKINLKNFYQKKWCPFVD